MPLDLPFDPIARAQETWTGRFGPDAPAQAMATATSVLRVAQLLTTAFDQACAPHGLTFARYEALVLLSFARPEGLPMSVVGERLMVHPTSATHIVQRLAAQGLVERVPNPRDGRGTLARITDEGRRVMQECTRDLHDCRFGVDALTSDDQGSLFALLRQVRVAAGDFRDEGHSD